MIKENFIKIYEESFKENWALPALTDYGKGKTFTFGDVATEIARIHLLFHECQVRRGDKIALIGKDSSRWCIAYMAVVTYGAIIVPILQDFNPNDVHHIINHSESVFLFVSDRIWDSLEEDKIEEVRGVFSLSDYRCLHQRDGENIQKLMKSLDEKMTEKYPDGFTQEDIKYAELDNDKVVEINYTSGTTGFSKGVMLTGNNLAGNVTYARTLDLLFRGERELCFLPLAHAYSCAFNLLVPMAFGVHVYLLGKVPSPKILLKAFEEVKPNLILMVPLILEKIYKKMILPQLNKRTLKLALNIPLLDSRIYAQIRKHLVDALGGRFREVIVGGAAMNQEVTDFLYKIKFPFTIGYGMTECGPLISYDHNNEYVPGSCGQILKGIMKVRIDSEDPYNKVGEIQVSGENVMKGYYNDEATQNVFTEDGWLRTGDLGTIDHDNRIFIRGRSKTMILGASGQNIYPEEIESKLNNLPFVMESLVVEKNGKLIGMVYPDYDTVDSTGISHTDLPVIMEQNRIELNKLLAPYETISEIQLYPTEFEKTPKKSIKRYLYSNY